MAFLGKLGPTDSDAIDKKSAFSVYSKSTILKWSDESSIENRKPVFILNLLFDYWVVSIFYVFLLEFMENSVSDADFIIVLFSTNSPDKSETFMPKISSDEITIGVVERF